MRTSHRETHLVRRIGWLRAAVLGANDGIISTASLVAGVAAASTGPSEVLVAGAAGLLAGAMSMAAGSAKFSLRSQARCATPSKPSLQAPSADEPTRLGPIARRCPTNGGQGSISAEANIRIVRVAYARTPQQPSDRKPRKAEAR